MKFKDHEPANRLKILSPCKTKTNENVRTKLISLFIKLLLLMPHNFHNSGSNFPGIFHSTSPDFFTTAFFTELDKIFYLTLTQTFKRTAYAQRYLQFAFKIGIFLSLQSIFSNHFSKTTSLNFISVKF